MISTKLVYGVIGVALLAGTASRYMSGQMLAEAPRIQGQNPNGIHIYMWGGLKSHGEGAHDYPHFFADWSEVLTDHGAVVDGALHPPGEADLEHTDVVLIYKGDAGFLSDREKTILENYVKRGGGIVSIHDSLCGPDPAWFAQTLAGGAKKHGEQNSAHDLQMHYQIDDKDSPILKDWNDLTFPDEAFFLMTWPKDPGIHALASVTIAGNGPHKGEVVPQMWTYEHTLAGGKPARAFVWMQGHTYENFSNPVIQKTLLRGIAWAGQRPYEELVAYCAAPESWARWTGRERSRRGGSVAAVSRDQISGDVSGHLRRAEARRAGPKPCPTATQ